MWTLNGGASEEGEEPTPAPDSPLDAPEPIAWLTILLFLGHTRDLYLIGKAVAEQYPTAEAFEDARNDPAIQRAAEEFAQLLNVLRARARQGGMWDIKALEAAGAEHYHAALATVTTLAGRLGLEPDTLLAAFASL